MEVRPFIQPAGTNAFSRGRVSTSGPILHAGSVAVYQSPTVNEILRPSESLAKNFFYGNYLVSNERRFDLFSPYVEHLGGTILGIGSCQLLSLASFSKASGVILYNNDPMVILTLSLALSFVGECTSKESFCDKVLGLINQNTDKSFFLDGIPSAFQTVYADHIDNIRRTPILKKQVQRMIRQDEASSFLRHNDCYDYVRNLVLKGAVSFVYGDFFKPDMPSLVENAMAVYPEKIRVIYLSNAAEWLAQRRIVASVGGFRALLNSELRNIDDGVLLMTTEFAGNDEIRKKIGAQGGFNYHALSLEQTAVLLDTQPSWCGLVQGLQSQHGI